jgi:hypothetical protein
MMYTREKQEAKINKLNQLAFDYLLQKGFRESIDHGGMFWFDKYKQPCSLTYKKNNIWIENEEQLKTFKSKVDSEVKAEKLEAERINKQIK